MLYYLYKMELTEQMDLGAMKGQMGQMDQMGQMGQMDLGAMKGQMGQMDLGAMKGQMGQMGQMPKGVEQIKDVLKIFDIFKPENLNNIISKLRMINPSKFDKIEELKDIGKKKKFELVKLKYVAKFINSLNESDINKFITSLSSNIMGKKKNVKGNLPLNDLGLGNSMQIDMYTIKDITSILIDINDEMYNLIQDFVNDQIKFVKKAQNLGNMSEAIDVRLIPKLLNILDQLSIANLNKILMIATTKFGVVIPVSGFEIKLLVKSLKIIFPLKNQSKLTSNIKNEMRYLVSTNNLRNENQGSIDKFKRVLKDKNTSNILSTIILSKNQISEDLKKNKESSLLIILLINAFYLTHNIKLLDLDKMKKIYALERKKNPNVTLKDVKERYKKEIISIYNKFLYTKGFIILLSKCALDYYHEKNDVKFFNILFHIIYSFKTSNNQLNIYHSDFDYELYLKSIENPIFKESVKEYNLENEFIEVCKIIFKNNSLTLNNIISFIYKIFKENKDKSSLLEINNLNNDLKFNDFFNKIMKKQYYLYISENDVSTLRLNKSINISKPLYFSLHQVSLSEYNSVNKFILRTNLNKSSTNILNENSENETENENNGNNVIYTKEELNGLIKLIKKRMYNNSEINKLIRNKNKDIYNSYELINKIKDLHKFELFILIIFKTFYKNIFDLLTKNVNPLAKEALTKV